MNDISIVLLTSTHLRHKYVARRLFDSFKLQGIIVEEKSASIENTSTYSYEDGELVSNHFAERGKSENEFFGTYNNFPKSDNITIGHGRINDWIVYEWIDSKNPDYIVLFGTSIVKNPILSKYNNRIINLHLGLSPYYKGAGTNLWPLYFNEPECVGATIHLAIKEVDAGAILHQVRPAINEADDIHSLGNKTIEAAGRVLPEIIRMYGEKRINPQSQSGNGKVMRKKDFSPDVLKKIYKNFNEGMLTDYLTNQIERLAAKPIIDTLN